MKRYVFHLLLIAFVLASCNKSLNHEDIVQPVLFEYEYVNHSWVYTHNGWMIDENGDVRGFNLPDNWTFPDADGYISKDDLKENLANTDTIFHTVNKDKMLNYFASRNKLLLGEVDTSDTMMADAGMSVMYVYVWNSNKELYKRKLLKSKGDFQLTNNSVKTKETVDWLESVGKKTGRFYWGF